jgi:hypothetical protein
MAFRVGKFSFLLGIAPAGALLAGCGAPGLPAKATVTLIDRKCEIIETVSDQVKDPRGKTVKLNVKEVNRSTGECKSVDEWEKLRTKRTKDVQGTATVHVDYQAPQDGSSHSGTLTFTGRDDEFYKLNAGDSIDIVVAPDDPAKIRKS